MNHRLWLIFLSSVICHPMSVGAFYGEDTFANIGEKTKQAYLITCKKTRALYEKVKKHKKLIAGVVVYLVFECVGYAQNWDTPLRRLLTPARLLEQAHATITNLNNVIIPGHLATINGYAAQIENLTNAHQHALAQQQVEHAQDLENQRLQILQQQQYAQQELQEHYQELEQQSQILHNNLDQELQRNQQLQGELSILTERSVALMSQFEEYMSK